MGALVVNSNGEILLVKSYKWGSKYTVPGGHIELGERSEVAVRREVKEEVGLEVEPTHIKTRRRTRKRIFIGAGGGI